MVWELLQHRALTEGVGRLSVLLGKGWTDGWADGYEVGALCAKPLDVDPLQLISHSQQIRHIRCCFGRRHPSGGVWWILSAFFSAALGGGRVG